MRITLLANVALLAAASIVSAHGVQTQITYDIAGNKIDTRSIIYTSANSISQPNPINIVTAPRRAYIEPLLLSPIGAGSGWYARPAPKLTAAGVPEHPTGPGPAFQYNDLLAGTGWSYNGSATLPNLQGTNFSYKLLDGLKQWDPATSTFIDPGDEQVQIIGSDGTASFSPTATNNITTSDSGQVGSLMFASITSKSANAHSSISIRLLGDGTTLAEGDDGIYLLKLALSTAATIGNTGVAVGDSDPFYFVLTKNVSYSEAFAAVTSLGVAPALIQGQVPEPTTVAALGTLAVLAVRRRNGV
jgi:hypothetical protein